jgi:hypothetical protein
MAGGVPRDPVQQEDRPVSDGDYQQANGVQAFKLGRLVLLGPGEGSVSMRDMQNLVKFMSAFEEQCGIYLGGPDGVDRQRLTQPMLTTMNGRHPAPTPCS